MTLLYALLANQATYWAIAGPNLAFNGNANHVSFWLILLAALVVSVAVAGKVTDFLIAREY